MHNDQSYSVEIQDNLPNDMVLSPKKYQLNITYPLRTPYEHAFSVSNKGMTRIQLVSLIVKCYRKIYQEEDSAVGKKTQNIPGMLNRDTSNGPYGIWGHNIEDLMLCSATISPNGTITVGVDS